MKRFYFFVVLCVTLVSVKAQNPATFDDLTLQPGSFWNGSDGSGGFKSGSFYFPNNYNQDWGSWTGFSISNMKDSVTAGYSNQYSAVTAKGVNSSENYAVAYISGTQTIEFDDPQIIQGFYATNATYTYLSMRDGDDFTKKFGGIDGTDPDFLRLLIYGIDIYGNTTDTVMFYLADFRDDNSVNDYIVKTWEWVDLKSLGAVTDLNLSFESTDMGAWGINTPTYFCMDNFNGVYPSNQEEVAEADFENFGLSNENFYNGSDGAGNFISGGITFLNSYNSEWASWSGFSVSNVTDNKTSGWGNQYSAVPGKGAIGTSNYAVAYNGGGLPEINFAGGVLSGLYITNSTYAYLSMKNGDDFSKKFGGIDGTAPDWFKVSMAGISEKGDTTGIVEYYLADFRFENNNEDYIVDEWKWIDLSSLGKITKIRFSLSSSDNGDWGMNTPAYFCIDQVNHFDLAPYVVNPVATISKDSNPNAEFTVSLDSVFADPDNQSEEINVKLEYIDNPDLLKGSVVKNSDSEDDKTLLSMEITPGKTGEANVVISATSNGKTVYHSFRVVISVKVSSQIVSNPNLKIYPNPVTSAFFIELPAETKNIVLLNVSGEIIYQQNNLLYDKIQINQLSDKPSGIYFVQIDLGENYVTKKVIKL